MAIIHVTPRRVPWWVRLYLPAILGGFAVTLTHLARTLFRRGRVTIQYPEETHRFPPGFRGEHVLKRDAEGHVKCVACFLCATACPAECITIVAEEAPKDWKDRDKVPRVFEIDMLKCIFCGFCEEACPCDAIALTDKPYTVTRSRADAIYGRDKLLGNHRPHGACAFAPADGVSRLDSSGLISPKPAG